MSGPYSAIDADVTIERSEVEHSIVLGGSRISDLAYRMEASLIGRNVVLERHQLAARAPTGSWSATTRRSSSIEGR